MSYSKLSQYCIASSFAVCLSAAAGQPDYNDHEKNLYLRADLGGASVNSGQTHLQSENVTYVANYDALNALNPVGDIGLGFNVNRYFRFDFLLGHLKVKWGGNSSRALSATLNSGNAYPFNTTGVTTDGLFNVYFNLAQYLELSRKVGFYLGGGAGLAHNKLSSTDTVLSVEPSGSSVGIYNVSVNGQSTTQFAWQLLAEMTYDLKEHLQANFTYRYLNAGHYVSSGTSQLVSGQATSNDLQTTPKLTLSANQFLVGLSYFF